MSKEESVTISLDPAAHSMLKALSVSGLSGLGSTVERVAETIVRRELPNEILTLHLREAQVLQARAKSGK